MDLAVKADELPAQWQLDYVEKYGAAPRFFAYSQLLEVHEKNKPAEELELKNPKSPKMRRKGQPQAPAPSKSEAGSSSSTSSSSRSTTPRSSLASKDGEDDGGSSSSDGESDASGPLSDDDDDDDESEWRAINGYLEAQRRATKAKQDGQEAKGSQSRSQAQAQTQVPSRKEPGVGASLADHIAAIGAIAKTVSTVDGLMWGEVEAARKELTKTQGVERAAMISMTKARKSQAASWKSQHSRMQMERKDAEDKVRVLETLASAKFYVRFGLGKCGKYG